MTFDPSMVCRCLRCGYEWVLRFPGQKPQRCARCRTPYWDTPPGKVSRGRPRKAGGKDPAAVKLGRRGGRRLVPKGFAKVDPKKHIEASHVGAKSRWDAYYQAHPEKLQAKMEREAKAARKRHN